MAIKVVQCVLVSTKDLVWRFHEVISSLSVVQIRRGNRDDLGIIVLNAL